MTSAFESHPVKSMSLRRDWLVYSRPGLKLRREPVPSETLELDRMAAGSNRPRDDSPKHPHYAVRKLRGGRLFCPPRPY